MHKTIILLLISLFLLVVINGAGAYGQEHKGITIQQVDCEEYNGVLDIQSQNQDLSNNVTTKQIGEGNQADINQLFVFQHGDDNSVSATQEGTGNTINSIQVGYMTYGMYMCGGYIQGINNQLISTQSGSYNDLFSLQLGYQNYAKINQTGVNNILFLLQKGNNNSVDEYNQTNDDTGHVLHESIIQIGSGHSLSVKDNPDCKQYGNSFYQDGTKLSLHFNNALFNAPGGVEVRQTGHDMKIVIDQSFFSFPMN
jgi:hypothetical protein